MQNLPQFVRVSTTPVLFWMVVSGKTLEAHHAILDKVRQLDGFTLMETSVMQDCQVTIVFCPISSRVGSDVESAMSLVAGKGDM